MDHFPSWETRLLKHTFLPSHPTLLVMLSSCKTRLAFGVPPAVCLDESALMRWGEGGGGGEAEGILLHFSSRWARKRNRCRRIRCILHKCPRCAYRLEFFQRVGSAL